MSHEFEDQTGQNNLGELVEDISGSRERDEFKSYAKEGEANSGHTSVGDRSGIPGPLHPAIGIPSDIEVEANIRGISGEVASPGIPGSVTSVYDARPINTRDFLHTDVQPMMKIEAGETPTAFTLEVNTSFPVPQGYTGVLRGFSYEADVIADFVFLTIIDPTKLGFIPVKSTLLVDELRVPDYVEMDLGQSVDSFMPTFVLANPGQNFTLRLLYDIDLANALLPDGVVPDISQVNIHMQLYGNLLLSRGLPKQFEISTQNYSGRVK